MSGLVGLYSANSIQSETVFQVQTACAMLKHRGSASSKIWHDDKVVIGHAEQSMFVPTNSPCHYFVGDAVVVSFDGTIFNCSELLYKYNMTSSNSPAEVVAEMYRYRGMEFVHDIEGDYAIIIYDKSSRKLFLIRDRLGVKPLVYTKTNEHTLYSSEIKSLRALPGVNISQNIDRICTDLAMWFWADKEQTYFENIYNVLPGEYIEVDSSRVKCVKYWDIDKNRYQNVTMEMVEDCLYNSVISRIADNTKYASLLSGGLDSSLLTAMISRNRSQITSYTIQYDDYYNNIDLFHAKDVAAHLGNINHRVNHIVDKELSIDTLDRLTCLLEEVVWDKVYFSMYSNYLNAAKDGFSTIVNGQGSDELLLGYYHDFPMYRYHRQDFTVDRLMQLFIHENIFGGEKSLTPYSLEVIENSLRLTVDRCLHADWLEQCPLDSVAYWSCKTYLQSNLMQEDRMSMASSVECRVPFINYHFVDLAFSLEPNQKVNQDNEKYILKELAKKYLPISVCTRRKQAFVNPENTYNTNIIQYYNENCRDILDNPALRKIFTDKFLAFALNSDNITNKEFIWKLVAIDRFTKLFS